MSGLSTYARAQNEIHNELFGSLDTDAIDDLRERSRALGKDGVQKFLLEHREEIVDYIQATPSERKRVRRLAAYTQSEHQGLFLLSCLIVLRCTAPITYIGHELMQNIGVSNRTMAGKAADLLFDEFWPGKMVWWPFDEDSPFES